MGVSINIERGGAEISWDPGDYVGPVLVRAVNAENGDVGVAKSDNDGKAFLTWPEGTWTDHITILADDEENKHHGNGARVIDEGDITVTVA